VSETFGLVNGKGLREMAKTNEKQLELPDAVKQAPVEKAPVEKADASEKRQVENIEIKILHQDNTVTLRITEVVERIRLLRVPFSDPRAQKAGAQFYKKIKAAKPEKKALVPWPPVPWEGADDDAFRI